MSTANQSARVAMIGAGRMANHVHYPSLASFPDVQIAAICDLDQERLTTTADKYGVDGRYADYRKMVDQVAPDGVYVIGAPHLMYDIWVWCLQQGLNLYIEKPMGVTYHQAQMLAELAERHANITQVSHQRRSAPIMRQMRAACLERGPISHAVCEFYKCEPDAAYTAYGRMLGDCSHTIDTVRWMCGGEVVAIDSRCKRLGTPDINWVGAMLHFDNGSTGFVLSSWSSGRRVFRAEIHGHGIYADVDVENEAWLYADGDVTGQRSDAREVAGGDELFVYGGFQAKNREFIDSLLAGKQLTSSPFSDCVKTMQVADTILANALLRNE